jgi:hypothetical protein
VASDLRNIGLVNIVLKKPQEALLYFQQALQAYRSIGMEERAIETEQMIKMVKTVIIK